jgi:hypothetical protein
VAAVIVEPVAGSAGWYLPPQGYLKRLREICDKHGILLIFDEVITGFGRMGTNFAADYYGVVPDMLNFAKAVTNGVIPLGGVICRDKLYDAMMKTEAPEHVIEFFHGYTYSGHPVACAAAIATLNLYKEENLFQRAGDMGKVLGDAFHSTFKGLPNVVGIRSLGLAAAVELAPMAGLPGKRAYDIFVDCFKNGVALEIEWNNKDPFFDRDLNNFRLLFELRVASVGVIVTRCDELQTIFNELDRGKSYGMSTTHMLKLLPKIYGGGAGGCPVLVFGMSKKLYEDPNVQGRPVRPA